MANKSSRLLAFMDQLSDSVFLYRPTVVVSASASDPQVILLLGWMDARDPHLAYYVQKYQDLFPVSSIILVKARTTGLALSSFGRRDTLSAIEPLRAILGHGDAEVLKPRLLIHAWSGGGSSSLYHLYSLYSPALPRHVTIFDSTPGVWSYSFASNVFTAGLQDGLLKLLVAIPLSHLVASISWLLIKFLAIVPDGQVSWSAAHNDHVTNQETRRTYIYSDVDKLVSATAVEAHAADAEAKGFVVWSRELFAGSGHVAHARSDPERYWRVVKETWEGLADR